MLKITRISAIILMSIGCLGFLCKQQKPGTKEARGLWVSRMEWAISVPGDRMAAQQQKIIEIFDTARRAGFNFILFQIRGNGDAFYRSKFEPWSDMLTGVLGQYPGWDPLAFAIQQAHQRGLELHVWFNTFPAWRGTAPPPRTDPLHVYLAHPEWIVCDANGVPMSLSSGYVYLSPGIPAVRQYIRRVAMDIVEKYDIDGFHFDYIRYPEEANTKGYSRDAISLQQFSSLSGNPNQLNWDDWQRENINQFLRQFYSDATSRKPWLKISAAVIGKYDYSEWNGYHVVYQDAKQWLAEGIVDFVVPMVYWQTNHPTAPYRKTVQHWFNMIHDRYIFPGMMINRLGEPDWPVDEIIDQIAINRHGTNGMVFFSYQGLAKVAGNLNFQGFDFLANLPPMPWKDDKPAMDPRNLRAHLLSSGNVLLIWSQPDSSIEPKDVQRYNVFRSELNPVDFFNAENLIHITAQADTFFIDRTVRPGHRYHYVVTALDRVNNESPPSNQVTIFIPRLAMADSNHAIVSRFETKFFQ